MVDQRFAAGASNVLVKGNLKRLTPLCIVNSVEVSHRGNALRGVEIIITYYAFARPTQEEGETRLNGPPFTLLRLHSTSSSAPSNLDSIEPLGGFDTS